MMDEALRRVSETNTLAFELVDAVSDVLLFSGPPGSMQLRDAQRRVFDILSKYEITPKPEFLHDPAQGKLNLPD